MRDGHGRIGTMVAAQGGRGSWGAPVARSTLIAASRLSTARITATRSVRARFWTSGCPVWASPRRLGVTGSWTELLSVLGRATREKAMRGVAKVSCERAPQPMGAANDRPDQVSRKAGQAPIGHFGSLSGTFSPQFR